MRQETNNTTTRSEKMKEKVKVEGEGLKVSHSQIKDELAWRGAARKVGLPHPKFTAGMSTNLEKAQQLCHVVAAVGNLAEELRILRQTEGVSAGEKKAIGAMLDKLGKFKDYAENCFIMKGGAK